MAALKALVIGMGVLIVVGMIGLVWAIMSRTGNSGAPLSATLSVPAGSQIRSLAATDARVYLALVDSAGKQVVRVLDAKTLQPVGQIALEPAP